VYQTLIIQETRKPVLYVLLFEHVFFNETRYSICFLCECELTVEVIVSPITMYVCYTRMYVENSAFVNNNCLRITMQANILEK